MIAADFLELLRCPRTGQSLACAAPGLLAEVNAASAAGGHGESSDILHEALVSQDGSTLYPVCDGIPVLLAERAILRQPSAQLSHSDL